METKDYKGLIASLEQSGVLTGFRSTALLQRLEFVLKENGDEFRRIVADGVAGSTPSERDALLRVLGSSGRSEEHTSELQSLMRISYAVFCLKKKKKPPQA